MFEGFIFASVMSVEALAGLELALPLPASILNRGCSDLYGLVIIIIVVIIITSDILLVEGGFAVVVGGLVRAVVVGGRKPTVRISDLLQCQGVIVGLPLSGVGLGRVILADVLVHPVSMA